MNTLKALIKLELFKNNWIPSDYSALAHKVYNTIVGEKEAQAYLMDFGDEEGRVLLQGTYYSEGRNILAAHAVSIPKNANFEQIEKLVKVFTERTDEVVGQSYAVRLLALKTN